MNYRSISLSSRIERRNFAHIILALILILPITVIWNPGVAEAYSVKRTSSGKLVFWWHNDRNFTDDIPCGRKSENNVFVPCNIEVMGMRIDGYCEMYADPDESTCGPWKTDWSPAAEAATFKWWTTRNSAGSFGAPETVFQYHYDGECVTVYDCIATKDPGGVQLLTANWPCSAAACRLGRAYTDIYTTGSVEGQICCADIYINRNSAVPWGYPSVGPNQYSLTSVIGHELGHTAGLGHSTQYGPELMQCYLSKGEDVTFKTADDANGIKFLYGRDGTQGSPSAAPSCPDAN